MVTELVDYDETLRPPPSPPYPGWNEQQTGKNMTQNT